ncbi:hypothetical protein LTR53_013631 [Teratosphaeriaceae sp. CCFEE 6253]|nr:hypothetical protein LTR53_013631 [Teratosphaeriaceae sp. CCFEE 6253]
MCTSIFKAVLAVLCITLACAASPTTPQYSNDSSLAVADGRQVTCSAASSLAFDRSCVTATIEHFCYDHDGYRFPEKARRSSLRGSYYVEPNATAQLAPIVLSIWQPAGGPYNSCSNTLEARECIADFTAAVDRCNGRHPLNVTSGGAFIDSTCRWKWEVDVGPRVPVVEASALDVPEAEHVALGAPVTSHPYCYPEGFAWPTQAIGQGLDDFCDDLDERHVDAGRNFDMFFYYLFNFSKKPATPRKAVRTPSPIPPLDA